MATFRFPLQRLLDLRATTEDQARGDLVVSRQITSREQAVLDGYREAYARSTALACAGEGRLEQRGLLLNSSLHAAHLRAQAQAQATRVEDCARHEADCRERLLAAAREREVLDRLREARWQQYVSARERRQQQALDEAGTMIHLARRTA